MSRITSDIPAVAPPSAVGAPTPSHPATLNAPALPRRGWWQNPIIRNAWRFGILGPLIGGLPFTFWVILLDIAYKKAFVPAMCTGVCYGWWRSVQSSSSPRWWTRMAVGAALGALLTALWGPFEPGMSWHVNAFWWHYQIRAGLIAGAVCAVLDLQKRAMPPVRPIAAGPSLRSQMRLRW